MSHCRFSCISEANLRKKRRKTCPNWRRRGDLTGTRFPIDFLVISYGKWFPIASWLQGFLGADLWVFYRFLISWGSWVVMFWCCWLTQWIHHCSMSFTLMFFVWLLKHSLLRPTWSACDVPWIPQCFLLTHNGYPIATLVSSHLAGWWFGTFC